MNTSLPEQTAASDIKVIPAGAGEQWWVITNHQEIKLTAGDTRGALSLWTETIPPGGGPPPHTHYAEDEIFVVTEGEITFQSGERRWVGHPGTVVFAPRGVPHAFKNTGSSPARMVLLVTPGGFENMFREVAFRWPGSESRPPVPREEYERLVKTAEKYDLVFHLPKNAH